MSVLSLVLSLCKRDLQQKRSSFCLLFFFLTSLPLFPNLSAQVSNKGRFEASSIPGKVDEKTEVEVSQISDEMLQEELKIESFRKRLAEFSKICFLELQKDSQEYERIDSEINEIKKAMISYDSYPLNDELIFFFSKVKKDWRQLIDDGFTIYHLAFDENDIEKLPATPGVFLSKQSDLDQQSYAKKFLIAKKELEVFSKSKKEILRRNIDKYFKVLKKVSEVRAKLLTQIDSHFLTVDDGSNYIKDVFREIWAIPVHLVGFLHSKYVDISSSLSNGFLGIWSLFKSFLFLISIPFFARRSTHFMTKTLDSYRKYLLKERQRVNPLNLRMALWIQEVAPYAPLLSYYIFLEITEHYLSGSIYEELQLVIPLIQYYIIYRIFRLIVTDVLKSLRSRIQIEKRESNPLIEQTTKKVGRFFFVSCALMHLTKATVDQGFIYSNMLILMKFLGFFVCVYAVKGWKEYLIPAVKNIYPGKFGNALAEKCAGRWAFFFYLPTLVFILIKIIAESLWGWVSDFETSKRFFAKIYRRKVESMGAQTVQASLDSIPNEYTQLFRLVKPIPSNLLVEANLEQFELVKTKIKEWVEVSQEDQSIVIYGEQGIGKTTFLDRIPHEFSDLDFIKINIPPKIITKEDLEMFLSSSLGLEKSTSLSRSILDYNKKVTKKTVLLVDDTHNMFVGKVGGFDAIKTFIDIVNLQTDNLFWCIAFNEYSGSYLKGILGNSDYFRTEILLKPWSDQSIQDLIMKRHRTTSFTLSYDKIILASRSASSNFEAIAYAEEQFFRILWEQSDGNPQVALFLWTNCLSSKGGNRLKVGLPDRPKTENLSFFEDNIWFVLSAIANHENITRTEITEASNIPRGAVSHSVKLAIEERLIYKNSKNRYQINLYYQSDLIHQLKIKNFIYGLD